MALRMPSGAAAWAAALPRFGGALVLAAGVSWISASTLQQDLAAYTTAGAALAHGLDPYRNYLPPNGPWDGVAIFRHSRFLYPPLMAVLFQPLAALPYPAAKTLFTALSALALVVALSWVRRAPAADDPGPARPLFAAALAVGDAVPLAVLCCAFWPPVFLVLERGQLDLLLLAALMAAWQSRERPLLAGPLLGIAIMSKPLLLGGLFALVAGRHYRWAAATALALAVLGVLNVAVAGGALSREYLAEVLPRAARYGEGGTEEMLLPETSADRPVAVASEGEADPGLVRLNGSGRAYPQELGSFARNASLPRLVAGEATPSLVVSVLLFLMLALPLAYGARRAPDDPAWYWGGLLAALITAPLAWAMELVWALPLLHLLLAEPHLRGRTTRRETVVQIAAVAAWLSALAGPFLGGAWSIAGLLLVLAAIAHLIQVRPDRGRS